MTLNQIYEAGITRAKKVKTKRKEGELDIIRKDLMTMTVCTTIKPDNREDVEFIVNIQLGMKSPDTCFKWRLKDDKVYNCEEFPGRYHYVLEWRNY